MSYPVESPLSTAPDVKLLAPRFSGTVQSSRGSLKQTDADIISLSEHARYKRAILQRLDTIGLVETARAGVRAIEENVLQLQNLATPLLAESFTTPTRDSDEAEKADKLVRAIDETARSAHYRDIFMLHGAVDTHRQLEIAVDNHAPADAPLLSVFDRFNHGDTLVYVLTDHAGLVRISKVRLDVEKTLSSVVVDLNQKFDGAVAARWDEQYGIVVEDTVEGHSELKLAFFKHDVRQYVFYVFQEGHAREEIIDLSSADGSGSVPLKIRRFDLTAGGLALMPRPPKERANNLTRALQQVQTAGKYYDGVLEHLQHDVRELNRQLEIIQGAAAETHVYRPQAGHLARFMAAQIENQPQVALQAQGYGLAASQLSAFA